MLEMHRLACLGLILLDYYRVGDDRTTRDSWGSIHD